VLSRRLTTIMLVRVILFTLILGGTIAVNLAWGTPEELGGPYMTLFFVFIAAIYLVNIVYAVLLRLIRDLAWLAVIQIAVDMISSAVLVHATGGADSAFVLFFLLSPIAAAVTLGRRSAVLTALAGALMLGALLLLGHARLLPVLPGQMQLPWEATAGAVGRSLVINSAALFAVAVLSGYLAEQLRSASKEVEVQRAFIDDLAALNADIIRCLTTGLITVSTDGIVLSMNRAASEMLGLADPPRLQGQRLADLVPELGEVVASRQEIRRLELSLRRPGTADPLLLGVSVSRLTDHSNTTRGSIINCQDLTAFRRMETAMKRSEHLASLGRMAAGIAHEIRNPLASMSGSLELLRGALQLGPEDQRLMDIALREIERLNGLITDFLDYARPRTPSLESFDLSLEIRRLVGSIGGLLSSERSPALNVEATEEALWVKADRDQLAGILWNLVRNAWEAGERQQIDVSLGRLSDGRVSLSVSDHAAGIAEKDLSHIFEPFFTTKDKGTGLGLATVHRMAQDHGGSIDVRSVSGQGTTFTILLPPCEPPPAGEE
jgi:two-component system sensor histidine kinase PilS (NtrC family)